ncbi:chromate transport protein ChrA [Paenibacillus sp. LBL]|nr:chromate transport protein ChrA [Paenibacillus sp. LBL]
MIGEYHGMECGADGLLLINAIRFQTKSQVKYSNHTRLQMSRIILVGGIVRASTLRMGHIYAAYVRLCALFFYFFLLLPLVRFSALLVVCGGLLAWCTLELVFDGTYGGRGFYSDENTCLQVSA